MKSIGAVVGASVDESVVAYKVVAIGSVFCLP